jgi:hypothetical protein
MQTTEGKTMKRVGSDMVQTVFALWLAALSALLVIHYVRPGDVWAAMLTRPVFLVIVPLMVAGIPLLAAKADQEAAGDTDLQSKPRWKDGVTLRKMVLIWLVSLVMFGAPHGTTPMAMLDSVWHNTVFLIVCPLLLACIPLLGLPRGLEIGLRPMSASSPWFLWRGLISTIILAVILVLCLIGVNSMKGAVGKLSVNIAILVLLAGDLAILWHALKQLRNLR